MAVVQKRRRRKRQKNRGRVGILLAAVTVAGAIAVMLLTPLFDIEEIKVSGSAVVPAESIVYASGIGVGQNIFRVGISEAENAIRALQYIDTVEIKRRLPDTIEIIVTEGTVKAYINSNGTYFGISIDGKILNSVAPTQSEAGRPVVEGLEIADPAVGSYYKALSPKKGAILENFLREFDDMGIIGEITSIDLSLGENIKFRYNTHLQVNFGTSEEFEYKLRFFERLLSTHLGTQAKGVISMENPERITFRDASSQSEAVMSEEE